MRALKLALLASACLPSIAHADPISLTLGNAIFAGLYSIGIPGAVANFIAVNGLAVVAAGAGLLTAATSGRSRAPVKTAEAKSTFSSEESPVVEAVGRVRIGGLKVYGNTDGSTRWRLIARLQGPIAGVEEHFVGGRSVAVDGDGAVSSPPWAKVGGSWMYIQDKRGDGSETAWDALVAAFPDLWTTNHKCRGIAQSLVTYLNPGLAEEKYLSLYQGGLPDTEQIIRGSLVHDVLGETSDPSNPATWSWSENSVDNIIHVMRRDPRLYDPDLYDWTLLALTAVKCNASVPTRTGTEKRSRIWGMWSYEGARSETLQQMLDSAGLVIRMSSAGKIYLDMVDDVPTAEVSFTDIDIIEDTWQAGPEAVNRPNIVRLKYYSPERDYETAEINLDGIAWARVDDEVERYGPKYLDIELPFCPSASQAQRVARRLFALQRAPNVTMKTNMVGLAAWGCEYGSVQTEYDDAPVLVKLSPPRVDDEEGTVEVPYTVWPSLPIWNPSTDEALAPDVTPAIGYATDLETPGAPSGFTQVTYPDGGKEFRAFFTVPDQDFTTVEAAYRYYITADEPTVWLSMTEVGNSFAYVNLDLAGAVVDLRVRVFDGDDGSNWSPQLKATVGTDNTATGAPDEVSNDSGVSGQIASLDIGVTAPEVQATHIVLEVQYDIGFGLSSWAGVTQKNCRPGATITFTDTFDAGPGGGTVNWRLSSRTSNGTVGSYLTYATTVPGSSPE